MPSPKPGTWVEFEDPARQATPTNAPVVVALFTSELAAMRSAMKHGNQVTHIPFGVTIEDHYQTINQADEATPLDISDDNPIDWGIQAPQYDVETGDRVEVRKPAARKSKGTS